MNEIHASPNPKNKTITRRIAASIWWVFESQWWVVREHTAGLIKCIQAGSLTAAAILIWAPIMCFPQWLLAPLFGFKTATLAIFGARVAAMCIVRRLDGIIPLTRALGLCHLLTFGPVLVLLLMSQHPIGENAFFDWFVWSQIVVIGICLLLDARDFLFFLAGYPYPVYIREGVLGGKLHVDDPRAHLDVNWSARLIGP